MTTRAAQAIGSALFFLPWKLIKIRTNGSRAVSPELDNLMFPQLCLRIPSGFRQRYSRARARVTLDSGTNKRISPHPVLLPMGEGTPELSAAEIQASLLPPHPLADAVTLLGKLAEASLLGEGQGEGRELRSWQDDPARMERRYQAAKRSNDWRITASSAYRRNR